MLGDTSDTRWTIHDCTGSLTFVPNEPKLKTIVHTNFLFQETTKAKTLTVVYYFNFDYENEEIKSKITNLGYIRTC